jgi:hypothetical protein
MFEAYTSASENISHRVMREFVVADGPAVRPVRRQSARLPASRTLDEDKGEELRMGQMTRIRIAKASDSQRWEPTNDEAVVELGWKA